MSPYERCQVPGCGKTGGCEHSALITDLRAVAPHLTPPLVVKATRLPVRLEAVPEHVEPETETTTLQPPAPIVSIVEHRADAKRVKSVVEILEEALVEARAGKLDAIMIVAESSEDFGVSTWWSGCPDVEQRVGKLEILKQKYVAHILGIKRLDGSEP